mmetsp:Transcript_52018/g.111328  ORF Transcript_52018/g.111328 Transcript_52018/m.111328 type:complete len:431 (-) Transcript_52018:207-1499(-)|eukprot:CAMPEP_0180615626 /NCGR_PEP_ID=MMETSP1037_2-20121125/32043_1 /TAXON_ID=632150 /ORGANISM="Azadinium spinosum, Strain 3D9" /LENGTH=430 /DNA_ID=CAMNT_0022635403 /DNA_START=66 /DNA_END=1358 /DNA_ORIENTATION=+
MAPMSLAFRIALLAHAVQSVRIESGREDAKDGAEVNSSVEGVDPPDVSSDMQSIFTGHKDIFGNDADESTWSATVQRGISPTKERVILTSDLFNSGATRPIMKRVLSFMLGHRKNMKALWILDARSGWSESAMAQVFLMDTLPEVMEFRGLGLRKNVGLWINRWDQEGAPMTMAKNLRLMPGRTNFEQTNVDAVKAIIDQADVLYVPGGNPYTLMKQLRSQWGSQIWAYAQERIRSGDLLYLARSAGSIVAGSIIETSPDPHPANFNMEGLDLLPVKMAYRPHYHGLYVNNQSSGHDDILARVVQKYPGVRGMHIHDGDILALNTGHLSLMHGGTVSANIFDDISSWFWDEEKQQVRPTVVLPDGTYRCCCTKARGKRVQCKLTHSHIFGCGMRSFAWDSTDPAKHPEFFGFSNAGRCMVPTSSLPPHVL